MNFDDEGEYKTFMIEQIVLLRLENLVLRIQMMIRRKLAVLRVKTQRIYLKTNPHQPKTPTAQYEIGAQVEARYNGRGDWYSGCIVGFAIKRVKKKPQVHYNILYDDGDRDEALSGDFIRYLNAEAAIEREKNRKAKRKQAGNFSDEEEEKRRLQEEELLKRLVKDANAQMEAERAKVEMLRNIKLMEEEAAFEEAKARAEEIAKAAEVKARTERNLLNARRDEERRVEHERVEAERRREEQERGAMLHEELYQIRIEQLRQLAIAKALAESKAKAQEEERIRREEEETRLKREEMERRAATAAAEAARQAQLQAEKLAEQKRLIKLEEAKRKDKERTQQLLVEAAKGYSQEQDEMQAQILNFEKERLSRLHKEQAIIVAQVVKVMTRSTVESIVESAKKKEQQRLQKIQLKKAVMFEKGYEHVTNRVIKKADKVISEVEVVEEKARLEQEAEAKALKESQDAELERKRSQAQAKSQISRDKRQIMIDRQNAIKKKNSETLSTVVTEWITEMTEDILTSRVELAKQGWIQLENLRKSQQDKAWEQRLRRVGAKVLNEISYKTTKAFTSAALTNRIRSMMIDILGDINVRVSLEEAVKIQTRKSLEERERQSWQRTMTPFFDRIHAALKSSGMTADAIAKTLLRLHKPQEGWLPSCHPVKMPIPLHQMTSALIDGVPMSITKADANSIYKAYSIDPLTNVDMLVDVSLFLQHAQLLMEDNIDVNVLASTTLLVDKKLETNEEEIDSEFADKKLEKEEEEEEEEELYLQESLDEENLQSEEHRIKEMEIAVNVCQQISNSLIMDITAIGVDYTVESILPRRIVAAAFHDEIMQTAIKKTALKLSVQRRGSTISAKVTRKK